MDAQRYDLLMARFDYLDACFAELLRRVPGPVMLQGEPFHSTGKFGPAATVPPEGGAIDTEERE